MRTVPPDLTRLARRVRQRRLQMGLTQRQAALAADVSDQTWLNVERATRVSERTLLGVERALKWQAGSAVDVLEGREPVETGGPGRSIEDRVATIEAELARLRADVAPVLAEREREADDPTLAGNLNRRPGRQPGDPSHAQQAG